MTETRINSDFLERMKKTRVRDVRECPDVSGLVLDGFQVLGRLGVSSGEADIYGCRGTGEDAGKRYVLKLYRREKAISPGVLEKLREIRNPCVCPVIHYGVYGGHQYTVLPYYEYPALSEALAAGERFSAKDLKSLIIPSVISGLRALHDAGILHKDLKPSNLIPDSTGEHIVLLDFGISSDAGNRTYVITETGMTPVYAAPEALMGIFHRETDYYAMGITVFELMTGFTPFQNGGISPEEAVRLAALNRISFPADFPEDFRDLVLGLTYRDLSHRNEPDHPCRRWGYDEVARWLRGERVPVPGENFSGVMAERASFPPYFFSGTRYKTAAELAKALLKFPEKGFRELGRGILAHHFGLFDEEKAALCRETEEEIRGSTDDEILYSYCRLLYRLNPGMTALCVSGREFRDLRELADALIAEGTELALSAGILKAPDSPLVRAVRKLLRNGFLEYYAESVIGDSAGGKILTRLRKLLASDSGGYSDAGAALMIGYALSPRRSFAVSGRIFESPEAFKKDMEKLSEQDAPSWQRLVRESRDELRFLCRCFPDSASRDGIRAVLDTAGVAVFGDGEYRFRNAEEFKEYVRECLGTGRKAELGSLLARYDLALSQVSERIWKSDARDFLEKAVSGQASGKDLPESGNGGPGNEAPGFIEVAGVRFPDLKPVTAKPGECLTFGTLLLQDGSRIPAEWLVLECKDGEVLVISRFGLPCREYRHRNSDPDWETSDLRKWLNGEFFRTAFSGEEQARIRESLLSNPDIPGHGAGAVTRDRIFCLGIAEAKRYFRNDADRRCAPLTGTGKRKTFACQGFCYWWLRSPGEAPGAVAVVGSDGAVDMFGGSADSEFVAVRPAMRILAGLPESSGTDP